MICMWHTLVTLETYVHLFWCIGLTLQVKVKCHARDSHRLFSVLQVLIKYTEVFLIGYLASVRAIQF